MTDLRDIRSAIDRQKGQRDRVTADMRQREANIVLFTERQVAAEKARAIIQEVAQLTQQELEYHVSELVSLALATVFVDDPYKFRVDFVIKRERTECELSFERDGERVNPMTASGGGAVDVAANALRFALWSLKSPRSRNTIVLDEPFRFLSKDLQGCAANMLKEISNKLGVQIVMVSHNPELIEAADKAFEVTMRNGVSQVKEVGNVETTRGAAGKGAGTRTSTNEQYATAGQGANEDRADERPRMDSDATTSSKYHRRGGRSNNDKQSGSGDSGTVPTKGMAGALRERGRRPRANT